MINAFWELFSLIDWPITSRKPATAKAVTAEDHKRAVGNCKVTDGVWKSAIYLGPGGPLMRDS